MKDGAKLHEEFTAIGHVVSDNGRKRIALKSTPYWTQCTQRLPVGAEVSLTVSTKKTTRSQQQLKYYHVILQLLADHCGYRHEELHDWVMRVHFGEKDMTLNGRTVKVRKSISNASNMPKYECVSLIEYVLELCADMDVHVPSMEELGFIAN